MPGQGTDPVDHSDPSSPLYKVERCGEEGEGQEEPASAQVLPGSAPRPLVPSPRISGRQLQFPGRPLGRRWIHGRDSSAVFPRGKEKSDNVRVLSWALILSSPLVTPSGF